MDGHMPKFTGTYSSVYKGTWENKPVGPYAHEKKFEFIVTAFRLLSR
jgi:hypothetical protein